MGQMNQDMSHASQQASIKKAVDDRKLFGLHSVVI